MRKTTYRKKTKLEESLWVHCNSYLRCYFNHRSPQDTLLHIMMVTSVCLEVYAIWVYALLLLCFDHWTSKHDLLGNWKLWRGSWVIIQCGWLLRHPTISSCVVYYSTLKTFPHCNFSPDFPETLSQNLICCYWLSVSGYNALWDTH